MVLVALLFVPCMVIVTTVAIPLLLLVIAIIAIPILLYLDCSNIMQIYPVTNSSSYLSEDAAVPLHSNRSSTPVPPAIGVSTLSSCRRGVETTTSNSSSSSFHKKKVTFQVCSMHSPRNDAFAQYQRPTPLHTQSSIEQPTSSLLLHRRIHSPSTFYRRDATPTMDLPYHDALQQPRPGHMYHHPICVS